MKTVRDIYNFLQYLRLNDLVIDINEFMVTNPMFSGYITDFKKLFMYRYLVKLKIENVSIKVYKNPRTHFVMFEGVDAVVYFDDDRPLIDEPMQCWLDEHNKKFMELNFDELEILKFYLEVIRQ